MLHTTLKILRMLVALVLLSGGSWILIKGGVLTTSRRST